MEADFQQYYHLDLEKELQNSVARCGRLFSQLPSKSRVVVALAPSKDWDWQSEVHSRILAKLDEIACILVNSHLKKGQKKAKPSEQFQPDYVKKAKDEAEAKRKQEKMLTREDMEQAKRFWQNRNPEARII